MPAICMTQGNDTFVSWAVCLLADAGLIKVTQLMRSGCSSCSSGKRAVLWFLMMRYVLPESSVPDLDDGWLMADDNAPE